VRRGDKAKKPGDDAGILVTLREAPRAVKALLLGVIVNKLGMFLQVFLVLFLTERGFSQLQAGFALGMYAVGSILGVLVGGALTDRLGIRRVILISLIGTAGLVVSLLYLNSFPAILVAVVLVGAIGQPYRPASSALLAELTPAHRRVMIFAMYRLALNIGATAAPLIGVALLSISYDLLFWCQAVAALGYAVIVAVALPRPEQSAKPVPAAPEPASDTAPAGPSGPAAEVGSGTGRPRSGYLAVLADRKFVLFLIAFFVNATVYVQYVSVLPLAMESAGLATIWYSLAISLNGFIVITCELLVTKVVQRWPMRFAAAAGFVLLACGRMFYALPGGVGIFLIGTLIWTLAEIVAGPTMSAFPAISSPARLRGRYIGSAQAVFGLGSAVGPVVGVFLWNSSGRAVWLYGGAACAVGLAAAWVGMRPSSRTGADRTEAGPDGEQSGEQGGGQGGEQGGPTAARSPSIAATRPVLRRASAVLAHTFARLAQTRAEAVRAATDAAKPPNPFELNVTYAGDSWSVSATRAGSTVVAHRQLAQSTALTVVAAVDAGDIVAAVEGVLADQRREAEVEADELRAALTRTEARVAEIAAREAELASLRTAAGPAEANRADAHGAEAPAAEANGMQASEPEVPGALVPSPPGAALTQLEGTASR
jgi:predicted MFS family arabinose efflux permease